MALPQQKWIPKLVKQERAAVGSRQRRHHRRMHVGYIRTKALASLVKNVGVDGETHQPLGGPVLRIRYGNHRQPFEHCRYIARRTTLFSVVPE